MPTRPPQGGGYGQQPFYPAHQGKHYNYLLSELI